MRVYLPSTLPGVAALVDTGRIAPAPLAGYAVTVALAESAASDDVEELEYEAMDAAARASLRTLARERAGEAGDPASPQRRVVLAVDVEEHAVRPGGRVEPAAVHVTTEVPADRVAAAHVDEAAAVDDVAAAVVRLSAGDTGPAPAASDISDIFDMIAGRDLLWFAHRELADIAAWGRSSRTGGTVDDPYAAETSGRAGESGSTGTQ